MLFIEVITLTRVIAAPPRSLRAHEPRSASAQPSRARVGPAMRGRRPFVEADPADPSQVRGFDVVQCGRALPAD